MKSNTINNIRIALSGLALLLSGTLFAQQDSALHCDRRTRFSTGNSSRRKNCYEAGCCGD